MTGRKTGKVRRKCLRASRRGETVFILMLRPPQVALERPSAIAAWVRNVRANPHLKIRLSGRSFDGVVREITDDATREEARAALCEHVHLVDYDECALHLRGLPTRAKIIALHEYWFDTGIPFAVELRGRAGGGLLPNRRKRRLP
jgi:hypothetical protein